MSLQANSEVRVSDEWNRKNTLTFVTETANLNLNSCVMYMMDLLCICGFVHKFQQLLTIWFINNHSHFINEIFQVPATLSMI